MSAFGGAGDAMPVEHAALQPEPPPPPRGCRCRHARRPLCDGCRSLQALTPLIRRRLRRFAAGYGCRLQADDADDLAQQVLVELARSGWPDEALPALARVAARRRLIDWMDRSARSRFESWGDRLNGCAARPEPADLALDVTAAMARMPEEERGVFRARAVEGLSFDDAADELGVPLHTVRTAWRRAARFVADYSPAEDTG